MGREEVATARTLTGCCDRGEAANSGGTGLGQRRRRRWRASVGYDDRSEVNSGDMGEMDSSSGSRQERVEGGLEDRMGKEI